MCAAGSDASGVDTVLSGSIRVPEGMAPPCSWRDPISKEGFVWLAENQEPQRRAGVGARLLYFLFDLVIAFVVAFVIVLVPLALLGDVLSEEVAAPLTFIFFWAAFAAYWAICYHLWGQTLAMRLGRIRVIDKGSGAPLSWGRSWLRAVVLLVSIPVPAGWIIWWAVTGTSEWRQGPHDFAAKSVVVES